MPRDYLNRTEREHIGLTYAMHFVMAEHVDQLEGDEKKFLKMSLTYYQKFMERLAARVGPTAMGRMKNDFKNAHVYYSAAKPKDRETLTLEIEAVKDLSEGIIKRFCKKCRDPEKKDCTVRDILLEADVPVIGTICPYFE